MVDSRAIRRAPSDPHPVRTLSSAERIRLTDQLLREAHATVDEPARCALLERVSLLNRGVAEAVAKRYRGRGVPVEALYQAAFEGLAGAVRTFDPTVDADLLTYAVPRIHGEVQRWLRDQSWLIASQHPSHES
jgi:RNA polymerase sigma-B factor